MVFFIGSLNFSIMEIDVPFFLEIANCRRFTEYLRKHSKIESSVKCMTNETELSKLDYEKILTRAKCESTQNSFNEYDVKSFIFFKFILINCTMSTIIIYICCKLS